MCWSRDRTVCVTAARSGLIQLFSVSQLAGLAPWLRYSIIDLTVEASADNALSARVWGRTWFLQESFKRKTSQTPPLCQPNSLEKVGQSWPIFHVLQAAHADLHVSRSPKMYYMPNIAKQRRNAESILQEGDKNVPIWTHAAPVCARVSWMGNWDQDDQALWASAALFDLTLPDSLSASPTVGHVL